MCVLFFLQTKKYRSDGYDWKTRRLAKNSIREDRMKLKVGGFQVWGLAFENRWSSGKMRDRHKIVLLILNSSHLFSLLPPSSSLLFFPPLLPSSSTIFLPPFSSLPPPSFLQLLYACYTHSASNPDFHRRSYWLIQVRTSIGRTVLLPPSLVFQSWGYLTLHWVIL